MALQPKRFKTTVLHDDYMVRDHLVHGVRILPGVFFLDLTYRMARQLGLDQRQVELRRCLFIEPISVTEAYDRQVQISIVPRENHAEVSVESRKIKEGVALEEKWTSHFTGELHLSAPEPQPRLELARIQAAASRRADADELYAFARSVEIHHQEFMKAVGTLHYGPGSLLAEVTLSELAQGYLEHFHTHPAYLDFSTLMPFCLFDKAAAAERQPFIPLFIESFRAYGPLGRSCFAYVEQEGHQSLATDTVHSDIRLFSPEGELLVHFRKFCAKKIRSRSLITQAQASSPAPVAMAQPTPPLPPVAPRASASAAPRERVQAELCAMIARALKRRPEDVDVNAGFYEQGLASVDLLQLVRALEARLGRELYPTLLFEYTTVSALAGYLAEQFADLLASASEPSTPEPQPQPQPQVVPPVPPAATAHAVELPKPAPRSAAFQPEAPEEEIAIVGVAGRYPQARNLTEFWAHLKVGKDCITEVPASRWDTSSFFDPERGKPGRSYSKWGGFIDGVDEFDPLFFNISPREAEMMDPQERLFLETAWAALEDAGYTRERLGTGKGNDIGVFAGVMWSDYQLFGLEQILQGNPVVAGSWFSSVANRVSYFLNLQGPSVPVDTACSSALYAIHLACESIRRGECSAAIAGAVNASLHPSKYLKLSELQMLSTDGRCRTFGKGGNGYVPGEGVGAVLLKPLSRAIADRDTVYAVIKSTAVNHGGRTSGFSVPSPDAQARLIREALEKARIPASTVSYIEAHGTGTSLGDPIEIAGLTSAFRGESSEKGFCAVGSVKSNIGHLEAAAGIAGLTKVLLCMRHRMLVPSLHSRELNPSIPFSDTPFYVPQEARPWEKRAGHPRRAGISSFGAGGANAHIILEEYEDPRSGHEPSTGQPQLMVLSARTPERLQAHARQLRDFLATSSEATRLEDLAYTLQVGREAMEARLAVVAHDKAELRRALDGYLSGSPEGARLVLTGQVKRGASALGSEAEDQAYLHSLWQGGKLSRLAALWTEGAEIAWSRYERPSPPPRRIPLPTYPFARKRCWIPQLSVARGGLFVAGAQTAQALHPLIDANTSTLEGPRFHKHLQGTEFYVADHVIREHRLLPGVVSLELARAAGALASEAGSAQLRNVLWASPIVVDAPRDIAIRLRPGGAHADFEVVTGTGAQATVHTRGRLMLGAGAAERPAPVSIEELQRRCAQVQSQEALYAGFAARGFRYGPGLRSIHELRTGSNEALAELRLPEHLQGDASAYGLHPALLDGALQAVSGLTPPPPEGEGELLPFSLGELQLWGALPSRCFVHVSAAGEREASTGTPTRFHLSLLDEAGRALVTLRDFALRRMAREELPAQRPVNKAEGLLIYEPCWEDAPSPAPYAPAGSDAQRPFLVFEREEAQAQELRRQLRERSSAAPVILVQPGEGFRCLSPEHYQISPSREEDYRQLLEALRERGLQPAGLFHLWNRTARPIAFDNPSSAEALATEVQEQLRTGLQSLFLLARTLPALRLKERLPVIYAFHGEGMQPQHSAVAGLARSAALENPKLRVRVVQLGSRQAGASASWEALLHELQPPEQVEVRLSASGRQVRRFAPMLPPSAGVGSTPRLLRPRGVYLITGGAGGLGLVFARYLAREAQARIALIGRSPLDEARHASLAELGALGAEVVYLSADVADAAALRSAVASVRERFGALHGVIHAAGVIEDAMAVNKPLESFQRVLGPKIQGALNLDAATREVPLDFLVLFSSASAVFGSMGQTDYAAGNQFMDTLAALREGLREKGLRSGRTISLNWPLWREGGMRIQAEVEEMILRNTGLRVLETERGLAAFTLAQSLPGAQLMLLDGDTAVIHRRIELAERPATAPAALPPPVASAAVSEPPQAPAPAPVAKQESPAAQRPTALPASPVTSPSREALQAQVERDLSTTCSALLKVSEDELDAEADFSDYGVDSLVTMKILDHLEHRYGVSLDPSATAEHPTIRSLAKHLLAEHGSAVEAKLTAPAIPPAPSSTPAPSSAPEPLSPPPASAVPAPVPAAAPSAPILPRPSGAPRRIAVIGMACRFPGSNSIESFWDNLVAGRDLITGVPEERWDAERYYDPRKAVPNKSYSKWGGFTQDVGLFDAAFFGISPEDADWMDPQQRLALETAQELLDRAGYTREEVAHSRTAVFLGATANDYVRSGFRGQKRSTPQLLLNTLQNMVAARISHFYDLKGPSLIVDTACSSSLVAIHQACRSLLAGEASMAIAGGLYLMLDPFLHVSFSQAQVLSEDGRTRIFDSKASGFTPGEGVGMVLLKEYEQAVRDGDRILATVLGSAVNNDGRTLGTTMPSKAAQVEVIGEALRVAGVSADEIGYLETHGSGNAFGDPLEIHAATEVFRRDTSRRQYCGVGSVKSNIGALLQAGAAASFIKGVLALQHRQLPATLHCEAPHPRFRFPETPFFPVTSPLAWEPQGRPRRAAISSFGMGGTNCHLILGEADELHPGYKPTRQPLAPTRFQRQRHWMPWNEPLEPRPEAPTLSLSEATTSYLTRQLAALGKASVPERNFMELGLGSADLLELNTRLEKDLGIDLVPTVFFDHASTRRLADYLTRTFPERLAQALGPERGHVSPTPTPPPTPLPTPIVPSSAPAQERAPQVDIPGVREEDIAIIGMAGLFSQSPDLDTFWKNLAAAKDLIEEVPRSRWDASAWYDPTQTLPNRISCKWGSFVPDVDTFDALFFHISPREAEAMDPQVRLLLQVLYNAAEDAGCLPALRGSRTGMFVGACFRDYDDEMLRRGLSVGPHDGTGNAATMLANRPSFFFDLKGPSLTVDTACSSSLVALHLACQALRRGECEMAFAGGVNLILSPRHYLHFSAMKALSPTGRCHAFDSAADGYVPGEAVAAVLLKPLTHALRDGDPIHAVIKGTAVNHGGYTNSITAPSPAMQSELLLEAWKNAAIDPETLSYLEAHGTGTRLGDPIEVEGLKLAFARHTAKQRFCALGSAKAHLGHTEAAAGLTGLIKVVLSMKRGQIPAMPGFRELNPYIKLDGSPLYINEKPKPWLTPAGILRRAGVSSFGFGGANAHAVLEEYVQPPPQDDVSGTPWIFPFSARDGVRLRELVERFLGFLSRDASASLVEIAHTLQVGREAMTSRLAVIASSREALEQGLTAFLEHREAPLPSLVRATPQGAVLLRPEEVTPDRQPVELMAGQWLRGETVTWPTLTAEGPPRRVSLPTSTFARERYWLTELSEATAPEPATAQPVPAQSGPTLTWFKPEWTPSPLPAPGSADVSNEAVLVFDRDDSIAELLKARSGSGRVVVRIRPGASFRLVGPRDYEIDPGRAGDYERLLTALSVEGLRLGSVLFFWGERSRFETPEALLDGLDHALEQGLYPVVQLVQALLSHRKDERIRMLYFYPAGEAGVIAHHEALAGFARAATAAAPWLTLRLMGVDAPGTAPGLLLEQALAELQSGDPQVEVRYRGGERQVRTVLPVAAHEAASAAEPAFRQGGIYLVTGGLGGVGYELAKHLAERYRARLVLTGRSPLSDGLRGKLARLEELGADAVYVQADVVSRKEVDQCLAYVKARFSGLHGIIHCAGLLSEGTLANKRRTDFEATLASKVRGTLVLDQATRAEPLELFVLFSSVSTQIGTALAADYATANRFLDGFASLRESLRQRGLRQGQTLSLCYPYWRDGGMRMSAEKEALVIQSTGMEPLTSAQGLQALETALVLGKRQGLPQLITAFGDLEKISRVLQSPLAPIAQRVATQPVAPPAPPQPSGAGRAALEARLISDLRDLVVGTLRLKGSVEPRADLSSYGFESITILEFTQAMNTRYGTTLSPALFYEHRTIESYARFLAAQQAPGILKLSAELAPSASPGTSAPSPTVAAPPVATPPMAPVSAPSSSLREERSTARTAEDIAVVGMAGVFPGSPDLETFWSNLEAGKDLVGEIPHERFRWEDYCGEGVPEERRITSRHGGFLQDVASFDPLLFQLSPLEAELMDPQQRLFLEMVWRTLEDAGYRPETLAQRKTGVFVGVSNVDYRDVLAEAGRLAEAYITTGLSTSLVPNRVSYLFGWSGPSEPVDTGCSSSLVALHRAVTALHAGDCDAAVVGGVNLLLSPTPFIACSRAGMLSPDGRCMTFDKRANGYVRGEGAGALLLKPLSRAIADGDRIHAVIRGTAVNHGGRAQGLTVPNPTAQAEVLISVYEKTGVDPATLGFIEAHGTGTSLGDPIEVNGLRKLFAHFHGNTLPTGARCGLGTVKTNIGHLESAAGIAGLIKVILSLKHRTLPASLHCQEVNPFIDMTGSPLHVVRETQPWEALVDAHGQPLPRRAGVSSFGFGGVNAHALLEEYRESPTAQAETAARSTGGRELIALSARTPERLAEMARRLASFLLQAGAHAPSLPDIARTLREGRREMEHRLAILASSTAELCLRLEDFVSGKKHEDLLAGKVSSEAHSLHMLGESNEGRLFLDSLIRKGSLADLGRLWVQGTSLPDSAFAQGGPRRIVSLPGYPFARVRCWPRAKGSTPATRPAAVSLPAPVELRAEQAPRPAAPPPSAPPPAPAAAAPRVTIRAANVQEGVCEYLRAVLAQVLMIPAEEIDVATPFPAYGIDSMVSVDIVKRLERDFGTLQRSLLFEYVSIAPLADFLAAEYRERCEALFGPGAQATPLALVPLADGDAQEQPAQEQPAPALPSPQSSAPAPTPPKAPAPAAPPPVSTWPRATSARPVDIAVIGMGGIFPGSRDLKAFWRNLEECRDLITEVPAERFDWRKYFGDARREQHKSITRWGGFIDEVDRFDPLFFNIAPREAELMDPKQRLFLEVVWRAIEDAGYRPSSFKKTNTGVFVGTTSMDYYQVLYDAGLHDDAYAPTGIAPAVLANRVSFFLGLHGPSEPIDTACSSSLVALHNAVRAIQMGDCDQAIAGGVNVLLTPELFVAFSQGGFMSPDGRCKSFSRAANGFVRGEGAGAVLLKPLDKAVADGDHIYAVIKGSGVNHGGEVQSLTVPNPWAQAELIASVLERAGIDPETVGYVETHGTGTALGDPLEVNGLKRAFSQLLKKHGREPSRAGFCGLGALKSNIGHLEAAAGIAGVIKVLLCMRHRRLPGIVHLREVNPDIDLRNSPFYLLDQTRPWEPQRDAQGNVLPLRAGVTSLGFGGSNAHMVLEEYVPPVERRRPSQPPARAGEPHLFLLSVKAEDRLRPYVESLLSRLSEGDLRDEDLADVASTLQTGRDALPVRLAVLATHLEELKTRCREWLEGRADERHVRSATVPKKRGARKGPAPEEGSTAALEQALANRDLLELAKLWLSGVEIPWEALHPAGARRRLPLPTYPFSRERYWVQPAQEPARPSSPAPAPTAPEPQPPAAKEELRELLRQLKHRERSVDEVAKLLRG